MVDVRGIRSGAPAPNGPGRSPRDAETENARGAAYALVGVDRETPTAEDASDGPAPYRVTVEANGTSARFASATPHRGDELGGRLGEQDHVPPLRRRLAGDLDVWEPGAGAPVSMSERSAFVTRSSSLTRGTVAPRRFARPR